MSIRGNVLPPVIRSRLYPKIVVNSCKRYISKFRKTLTNKRSSIKCNFKLEDSENKLFLGDAYVAVHVCYMDSGQSATE